MESEKYEAALKEFQPIANDQEITKVVEAIIEKNYVQNNTKEVLKFLHSTIDLTSLGSTDTEEAIHEFTNKVNDFEPTELDIPNVAAICVYPNFVKTVKETLTDTNVKIASVSGCFPSSQSFQEIKIAETSLAVADGSDEIDIVLNMGAFFSGDYEAVCTEIEEQKTACRNAHLKVILETGALKTAENIRKASILSLFSGADFIKTSTGKEYPGASLEAAYVMATTLKEYYDKYDIKRGLKVSGGVRTPEEAVKYYCIVKEVLGNEWLTNTLFRIGASSLQGNLLKELVK